MVSPLRRTSFKTAALILRMILAKLMCQDVRDGLELVRCRYVTNDLEVHSLVLDLCDTRGCKARLYLIAMG